MSRRVRKDTILKNEQTRGPGLLYGDPSDVLTHVTEEGGWGVSPFSVARKVWDKVKSSYKNTSFHWFSFLWYTMAQRGWKKAMLWQKDPTHTEYPRLVSHPGWERFTVRHKINL